MPVGSFLEGANNGITSTSNYISQQTANLNAAVDTVNQGIGTAEGILGAIGLGGHLSGTIGSVLANNFNLSCWGASLTPQSAADRINRTYKPGFTYLANQFDVAGNPTLKMEAFNEFIKMVYVVHEYYVNKKITEAGWSSCAKKAINEVYKPFFAQIKTQVDKILIDMMNQGATKQMVTMKPINYVFPKEWTGETKDWNYKNPSKGKNWEVSYPVITKATPVLPVTNPANTTILPSEHTTLFGPKFPEEGEDVANDRNPDGKPDESSGMSTLIKAGIGYFLFRGLF